MGTTEAPTMASPRSPTVDETPPTCNYQGVSINNTVFVKQSVTLWSDACEYGIGGYSENCLAWRWKILDASHGKPTLNFLEFLASAVTIYITILQLGQGSHILAFTDSSSALGWMHKASFDPLNAKSHDAVAQWLGWTLISHETCLYSQHIKGTENIISDSLSRDLHKSNQTLTNIFNQILPQQTAASFHIKQLPRNIISSISSLAATSKLPTAPPKPLQPSSLANGKGGTHSSNTQESQTNYWKESHKRRKQS